jgi:hypothetical protein
MLLLFFVVRNVVISNAKSPDPDKCPQWFGNSCQTILPVCQHIPHKLHEHMAINQIEQNAGYFFDL